MARHVCRSVETCVIAVYLRSVSASLEGTHVPFRVSWLRDSRKHRVAGAIVWQIDPLLFSLRPLNLVDQGSRAAIVRRFRAPQHAVLVQPVLLFYTFLEINALLDIRPADI